MRKYMGQLVMHGYYARICICFTRPARHYALKGFKRTQIGKLSVRDKWDKSARMEKIQNKGLWI
jgi:hypothetical protein